MKVGHFMLEMRTRHLKLYLHSVAPEILSVFKNGYSIRKFCKDIYAGLIVAVISFPLAMALAIASGVSPEKGLITAIVAGIFTSLFGGCKYQIGGPTGAFVVIIFNIIQTHGYNGLVLATMMAGIILIICGFLKVGKIIQYIPYTVVMGFTVGIGITILSTQLNDFFGITSKDVQGGGIDRIIFAYTHIRNCSFYAIVLGSITAIIIFILQKYKPLLPRFLIALLIGVLATVIFGNSFETVGSRFVDLKWTGFSFMCPHITLEMVRQLFPSAITIAFLSGIESLLCCAIADGLTMDKHKSDSELIGQGVSNVFSAFAGGIPATGALARTVANVKAGAISPFAGIFQSIFVCSFMCFLMNYMKYIPMSCLAGMLVTIAWNMIGFKQCLYIFHSSKSDVLVFLVTLILTITVDITIAVEVGVLIALFLFVKRLIERAEVKVSNIAEEQSSMEDDNIELHRAIQCIKIRGPLFFGLTPMIGKVLTKTCKKPEVIILNFKDVPLIDVTGARMIRDVVARSSGVPVILTGLCRYTYEYLEHLDYKHEQRYGYLTKNMNDAIEIADNFLTKTPLA
jgi:SulP family sulfate permease